MKLATRIQGDGPAVLWLHGYTMRSLIWRDVWSRLPGWRHVGVDFPGHGGSPPIPDGMTLPQLAVEIAAVAEEHDARSVVALSFGTLVALQLAIDRLALVSKLVLAAPALAGGDTEPGADARYLELASLYRRGAAAQELADTWMSSPPDMFRGTELRPVLRFRLREMILRHSWAELGNGAMRELTTGPQKPEQLSAISAHLQVIVGDADMPVTRQTAQLLASTVPNARLNVLEGLGHLCLLEDPAATAPLIAAHLLAAVPHGGCASPRT